MLIIYNPHVDDFLATPPHFSLLKRRALKKYGFLLDGLIKQDNRLNVIIDSTISVFIPHKFFVVLPKPIREVIVKFEFKQWVKINKFENYINLINHSTDLSNDILLAFSYKSAVGGFLQRIELFNKFQRTVFHLSHYFVSTQVKADNLKLIKNLYLAGDSDITENSYFQNFFSWYVDKPFLVLPFAISSRFQVIKSFELRKDSCVATGSFHDLTKELPHKNYLDFITATGSITYHPIRKEIFDNKEVIANKVGCYVSPYRDYAKKSKLAQFIKHFAVSQKKYFSIDIVERYNDYKFAVVGEELSGFPALGAFEAIACGCILIADPAFYKGTWLVENKHFIPYNGSLSGLLNSIDLALQMDKQQLNLIQFESKKQVDKFYSTTAMCNEWNIRLLSE